jgi:pimeloyl-ACP methyl ester carboxylesterase
MRIRAITIVVLFLFCIQQANAATSLPLKVAGDVVLDARYYAAAKPGPGLLFLNMCDPSDDQTAWANVATALNERGFHVLTFDYRGFAKSGGEMPTGLNSVAEAMPYWRENWVPDVEAAYHLLQDQDGVDISSMGIAGASCGVFLGLEFAQAHPNVKTIALLGGPSDASQRDKISAMSEVPILLISGNERGPNEAKGTLEWSEEVFNASSNINTRFMKYRTVTHGTKIFDFHPETEQMVIDWFVDTLATD